MRKFKVIAFKKRDTLNQSNLTHSNKVSSATPKKHFDYYLIFTVIVLSLFGLLMVYSASYAEGQREIGDKYHFIKQQGIWFIIGFLAMGFCSFFDYHNLEKLKTPFFLISILLLILVFVPGFGVSVGGAQRWLKLGLFTIQPAEFVKLSTIILLASAFRKKINSNNFFVILAGILLVIALFQRDLGTAIVFSLIAFGMYFLAGAPLKHLLIMSVSGFIGLLGFILSSSYRKNRVLAFLDPFADPQGYTYHILQILIALGSGGFMGLGIGQSRQKFAYIPEVTTDSIFSVVGEELGFLGGLFLILLLGFLIYRAFKIAENAADDFGRLLAQGLTIWLASQTVVNLGAMVALIPLTGVPLPFISYGGSALLTNLITIGILLNISRQSHN